MNAGETPAGGLNGRWEVTSPIVVPLDGSSMAERALPCAVGMARVTGSVINLVRVQVPALTVSSGRIPREVKIAYAEEVEEAAQSAGDYLQRVAETLRTQLGSEAVTTTLVRDELNVSEGILRVADATDAGMIVIGTRDRSPFARLAWFSVADALIRNSSRPVVLVTERTRVPTDWFPQRILFPVAETRRNTPALIAAAQLLDRLGAETTLLRVLAPDDWIGEDAGRGRFTNESRRRARTTSAVTDLYRASSIVGNGAAVATRIVRDADTDRAILRVARELGSDMIVMTTRRRGGLEVLLGSTATGVLRRTELPVVAIGSRAAAGELHDEILDKESPEETPLFV